MKVKSKISARGPMNTRSLKSHSYNRIIAPFETLLDNSTYDTLDGQVLSSRL